MNKKGFTLIELIVVVTLIALLSSLAGPKMREQVAKGKDARAIALLAALRSVSEVYYADNESTPFSAATSSPDFSSGGNTDGEISENDKLALDLIIPELNLSAKKLFKGSNGNWDVSDGDRSYEVVIGGSRESKTDNLVMGGTISFTFDSPDEGTDTITSDGINIWFTAETSNGANHKFDSKKKEWALY